MPASDPAAAFKLSDLLFQRARAGEVVWIGVRPARGAPMIEVTRATLIADRGVEGDIAAARPAGKRQISLLQAEHLPVIAALSQRDEVAPALLRRNLVVRGINVLALRNTRFRVGSALLEGTGTCDPCSKMERALGRGGYNAMRGHGGILARIIEGGEIELGASVDFPD